MLHVCHPSSKQRLFVLIRGLHSSGNKVALTANATRQFENTFRSTKFHSADWTKGWRACGWLPSEETSSCSGNSCLKRHCRCAQGRSGSGTARRGGLSSGWHPLVLPSGTDCRPMPPPVSTGRTSWWHQARSTHVFHGSRVASGVLQLGPCSCGTSREMLEQLGVCANGAATGTGGGTGSPHSFDPSSTSPNGKLLSRAVGSGTIRLWLHWMNWAYQVDRSSFSLQTDISFGGRLWEVLEKRKFVEILFTSVLFLQW